MRALSSLHHELNYMIYFIIIRVYKFVTTSDFDIEFTHLKIIYEKFFDHQIYQIKSSSDHNFFY